MAEFVNFRRQRRRSTSEREPKALVAPISGTQEDKRDRMTGAFIAQKKAPAKKRFKGIRGER